MVSRLLRRCLLALTLACVASCGPAADFPANGDFSRIAADLPEGWFLDPAQAGKGTVTVTGPGRLRLEPNAGNLPGGDGLGLGQLADAAPLRGKSVGVTAELASEGGARAVVGLVVLDRNGETLDTVLLRHEGATRTLSDSLADPLPDNADKLILFVTVEGTSGAALFDDIAVAEVAPPPSATSVPAGAGARIDLAGARPGAAWKPEVLGSNVEWIRNANGLWNERLGRVDPQILALSKEAGIKLLRFPGGVWSDAYDWRDGIGPQSERPATPHVPGDSETSRHVIGSDEIARFAQQIGARLVLTVNANTGTPELAAEWAAYIRDRYGPGLVAFWEIGNEHYMAEDLSGAERPPGDYAARLRAFAAAIRAEIPNAKIAGIGMLNYGNYRFNAYDDWNEVVLREAGDVIDLYAIHNAYAPITTERSMRRGARVYEAMLAAPSLVTKNLRDTSALIARLQPGRDIGLAVTEWGALFAVDPKSPYFDQAKTLGSAIFVSRTLNAFLRDPNTRAATALKLSDWLNMGWIGWTAGGWRATPTLDVIAMYSSTLSGRMLEMQVDSPGFRSRGTGFTAAVESAPVIDAVASRASDGSIGLVVGSADLTAEREVTIALPPGKWRMEGTRLTGPAPDSHRGTSPRPIPGLAFAKPEGFSSTGAFASSTAETVQRTTSSAQQVSGEMVISLPPTSLAALRFIPQ